jgi:hypothetical protein
MKDMHQGTARKMGGVAMTRRSITTVLAALLIALFVTVNALAVSADKGCDVANGDTLDQCVQWYAGQRNVIVTSIGSPVAVPTVEYRFIENNTTNLPTAQSAAPAIPSAVTNLHQLTVVPTCTGLDDSGYVPTCYTPQGDGTWRVTHKDWEGIWQSVGTVTTLPPPPLGPSHP